MVPAIQANGFYASKKPKGGILSSRIVGFIILAVLALMYIAQASQASTKNIDVQTLRLHADSLQAEVDQLKIEGDRAQTLEMISTQSSPLGLESVTEAEYLKK